MKTAKSIFQELAGRWKLDRVIPDIGTLAGEVVFTKTGDDQLLYEETGILSLHAGENLSTSRSYIYKLEGDQLKIFYNDPHRQGDLLHELSFTDQDGFAFSRHCHLCGDDKYDLTFRFNTDSSIEMKYEIVGPAKNYRMESLLRRFDL